MSDVKIPYVDDAPTSIQPYKNLTNTDQKPICICTDCQEVSFPISRPIVDIEELTSVSTVTSLYKGGVLKILLDIPLLGRANDLVYQLHPLPVPQAILGNNSGKAYILPKFSHIAVEESQRTYVLMNHQDVAACTELPAHKICKENLPVNENGKFRTCEAELLLNPSLSTF